MAAGDIEACRDAVYTLLDTIAGFKKLWKCDPDAIVTNCEIAVLADTGTHGQFGVMCRLVKPQFRLRVYLPMGAYPEGTETTIIALWDSMVSLFNSNVTLSNTAVWSKLSGYRLGFQTVAGVKCRIMEARLLAWIAKETIYS